MAIEGEVHDTGTALGTYFRSVATAFEATLAASRAFNTYDGMFTSIIFFLLLFFSIIPILPAVAFWGSKWITRQLSFNFGGWHLSIHSFLFWYLTLSAIFALLFSIRLKYSATQEKKHEPAIRLDELLNEPQMRFALCYSVKSEVDNYRTNKRATHMTTARSHWSTLLGMLQSTLGSKEYWISGGTKDADWQSAPAHKPKSYWPNRNARFFSQVHRLMETYSWFKLDPRTESVIFAFDGLIPKLDDRIKDKKDLSQVSDCLFSLCLYLYTQIPDNSDTERSKADLATLEETALMSFAQQIASLTPYTSETRVLPKIERSEVTKARLSKFLAVSVGNSTPFVRFISVWIFLQIFVAVAIALFLQTMKGLKLDSTLIALLIGSPFAIAAALTAIPTSPNTKAE